MTIVTAEKHCYTIAERLYTVIFFSFTLILQLRGMITESLNEDNFSDMNNQTTLVVLFIGNATD